MSTDPSLKHIRQRLVTFLHFIRGAFGPAVIRKLFTALFERIVLSLAFLRSKWQVLCEKERGSSSSLGPTKPNIDGEGGSTIDADVQSQVSVPQSTIDEQIVIPLHNVAFSLYPSSNGVHDGSRSSQTLDVHEMLPVSRDRSTLPSLHISEPDDSMPILFPEQLLLVSSPVATTRRLANSNRRIRGYHLPAGRSDSTESIEQLGSEEMSRLRGMTLVTEPSHFPVGSSKRLSTQETLISSPISVGDLKTPALPSRRIKPVAPENFQRHEKRRKIPKIGTTVKMSPFLIDFSDHDDIPGWTTCIHPEGGRYFHHAEKRIFTDVDLHDSAFMKRITNVIETIYSFIAEHDIKLPEKADLVLDVNLDEKFVRYVTDYYFADHESRTIFFLHEFSSDEIPHWSEIKGVSSGTHLRQALETQYWWHCHTYPNCIDLSDELVCELRSSLMHYIGDCMTSPYANSPYTLENLGNILNYVDSLHNNIGKPYSGCPSFLSRLMYSISNMKYLNFHGQPEARLNRDESVYGDRTNRRTWFIKSISMFLFSAPDVHLRTLQKMWVDGIMHQVVWAQSLKKVTDEWREFILYATVLLNANVAFLAIQSVDTNRNPYRSPAQVSSYCSISFSIGSIILGLILVRQNQTKHRETAYEVQEFLRNRAHPWLGLETVAIMFSLPYALLMWGMISFLMAFWLMCLQGSDAATRAFVLILCGVLLTFTIWCIWTSWEEQPKSDAKEAEEELSFEVDDPDKRKLKGFKFERDTPQPTKISRRPTILSWPTTLNSQLTRSSSSKTVVEESIELEDSGKGKSCS